MAGGYEGNGVGVGRAGTWVVGTPVEPQAHPGNRQAATWAAGEAHPPPNQSAYMNNPTPSASYSANHSNGGGAGSNPYVFVSPVPPAHSSSSSAYSSGRRPMDKLCDVLNRCGKRFEEATRRTEYMADSVWHHLKTGPSVTDAAIARLAQGTKVLTGGGQEKVFQHTFETLPGEKLMKAYACYLSTSSGPVIGTLYLSTKRLAFCSDNPLCRYTPTGQQEWMHYKVVVLIDQLSAVNPSANRMNPHERYIQVITGDGHEFWFMGFISYDKALKNINEALQQSRNH
ncbi:GEM-like protein 1 [Punica granatum]|uniref:GRAM domain-containing protein n=2 Tax=Punica granatum TaxID=22663 RepID=A0A218WRL1_PUNGR|nr:GEM-like protein 1 [Punica granatum]OWM75487.1 hypothetical protein CDL15_Pgr021651 [Punica granatum]PKI35600.1 hypothetical protein CRG98_044054 [Punica granatum]